MSECHLLRTRKHDVSCQQAEILFKECQTIHFLNIRQLERNFKETLLRGFSLA